MYFIEDPEVTLDEDGHDFPEGAEKSGGIEWSINVVGLGDDGVHYWIDMGMLGYPHMNVFGTDSGGADILHLAVRSETGKVVPSRETVYKVADFPNTPRAKIEQFYPRGTLTIKRSEHQVAVDCGDGHYVLKDDKTWHFSVDDKEKGIKAEFVHYGVGFPMWYSEKGKLRASTPHSIGGGYFWPGIIEGAITFEGRTVKIKGKGSRQRYFAADYCSEEVGGWHDWNWFHFDEMHGCVEEMKVSKYKVSSLYLLDEKQYFSDNNFDIEHHEWAYLPLLGAFIPTHYKVTLETEGGVLEMTGDVVGSFVWVKAEVPHCPFAMLDWDNLQGTFTYKDGRKRTLTNGMGGNMIRLWRPYPNFIPEISVPK